MFCLTPTKPSAFCYKNSRPPFPLAWGAYAQVDTDALPTVEDGFAINFVVKEPQIINPSALCFDKLGRLYVGAGPQYRNPKPDSPTDYIKILIDGVAETVKTFAEGLNSVQAMAWKCKELWGANLSFARAAIYSLLPRKAEGLVPMRLRNTRVK